MSTKSSQAVPSITRVSVAGPPLWLGKTKTATTQEVFDKLGRAWPDIARKPSSGTRPTEAGTRPGQCGQVSAPGRYTKSYICSSLMAGHVGRAPGRWLACHDRNAPRSSRARRDFSFLPDAIGEHVLRQKVGRLTRLESHASTPFTARVPDHVFRVPGHSGAIYRNPSVAKTPHRKTCTVADIGHEVIVQLGTGRMGTTSWVPSSCSWRLACSRLAEGIHTVVGCCNSFTND